MQRTFGQSLRAHRIARRASQEALARDAGVSTRHLSCLETGKALPSREMVRLLARTLRLPLRDQNVLLTSAGFAAVHPTSPIEGPALAPLFEAIDRLFEQQEPFGAILVDRTWNVVRTNRGATRLLSAFLDPASVPPELASNLVRATLHPRALRPYVANFEEVAGVVLDRLARMQQARPSDATLAALADEVRSYPGLSSASRLPEAGALPFAVLHLRRDALELRLFTMLTTLGTPLDATAEELTLESFFPVDDATRRWFEDGDGGSRRSAARRALAR